MARKLTIQDQSTIKYYNTKMVLDLIRRSEGISRSEIARETGMSPTSATRIVNDLVGLGLVRDTAVYTSSAGAGRRAVQVDIVPDAFYCVGIEISDVRLSMCILDFSGQAVAKAGRELPLAGQNVDTAVDWLSELFESMLAQSGIPREKLVSAGVGVIGSVDAGSGVILYSDLLRWTNVPIGAAVAERLGLPTCVDNDIKCAIRGEAAMPEMRHIDDVVMLSFGRGVGGAIINRGRLMRGSVNFAGEIGHTIVDHTDGRLCFCGRRGCLAAYLTEQKILEEAHKHDGEIGTTRDLIAAFSAGEPWAKILIDRIAGYLSLAISNVVCFLNPRNIIIGGSLIDENPFLFDLAVEHYHAMMYPPLMTATNFTKSRLGQDAASTGSALVALEKHTERYLQADE